MGAHPLYGALSQRGLLDPIKPAYNQSRLDGRLKLTASAFNQLRISMQAVLVALPTVMQNLLHPTTTFSIIAHHLLDFMVQGKIIGRCTNNPFGHHPIWIIDAPHPLSSSHFYAECPFCHNPFAFILAWGRHQIMPVCRSSG